MKQKTASVMRPIVEAYSCYKGSKKAFCLEHGLAVHTLNYWLGKLNDRLGSSSGFVALEVSSGSYEHRLEVHYPSGVRIVLPLEAPLGLLENLIQLGA